MRKLATLWMLVTALSIPAPVEAAVTLVVAGPGSQTTASYATPVVVAPVGGPLTFLNQDVQPHSVVSDAVGPDTANWCRFFPADACPLFWSPVTDAGGRQNAVQGLEKAASGSVYPFHCVIHEQVRGTLVVI